MRRLWQNMRTLTTQAIAQLDSLRGSSVKLGTMKCKQNKLLQNSWTDHPEPELSNTTTTTTTTTTTANNNNTNRRHANVSTESRVFPSNEHSKLTIHENSSWIDQTTTYTQYEFNQTN